MGAIGAAICLLCCTHTGAADAVSLTRTRPMHLYGFVLCGPRCTREHYLHCVHCSMLKLWKHAVCSSAVGRVGLVLHACVPWMLPAHVCLYCFTGSAGRPVRLCSSPWCSGLPFDAGRSVQLCVVLESSLFAHTEDIQWSLHYLCALIKNAGSQ